MQVSINNVLFFSIGCSIVSALRDLQPPDEQIKVCVMKNGKNRGAMRMVDKKSQCDQTEEFFTVFNVEGEAGVDGVDGIDGIDGIDGVDGVNGVNGEPGADGAGCEVATVIDDEFGSKVSISCGADTASVPVIDVSSIEISLTVLGDMIRELEARMTAAEEELLAETGTGGYVFLTQYDYLYDDQTGDEKCQMLAEEAGLPGTYKAWLTDNVDSFSYKGIDFYKNTKEETVFSSPAALETENPRLNVDQYGNEHFNLSGEYLFLTGKSTDCFHSMEEYDCMSSSERNGHTTTLKAYSDEDDYYSGRTDETTMHWNEGDFVKKCSEILFSSMEEGHYLCFQQGS